MLRIFSSGRVSDPFTARMTLLRSAVGFSGLDLDFEAWVSFTLFRDSPAFADRPARGLEYGFNDMRCKMPDYRRYEAIPRQMVSIVIAGWQRIVVRQAHESRSFPGRQ